MKRIILLLVTFTLVGCQSPWITTANTIRAEQYRSTKYHIGVPVAAPT